MVTELILSTKMNKGEILSYVKEELQAKWKGRTTEIEMEKIKKINLKMLLERVKSLTLKLLSILQANPPTAASWYPDNAVATLYRICRYSDLNSGFPALCNYLRGKTQSKSIPVPNPGIAFMLVMCLYGMHVQFARKIKDRAQRLLANQPNATHRCIPICKLLRPGIGLETSVKRVYGEGKLVQCCLSCFDTQLNIHSIVRLQLQKNGRGRGHGPRFQLLMQLLTVRIYRSAQMHRLVILSGAVKSVTVL